MPKTTLDGIIRICEEHFLVPTHLVPLDDIMEQHVAEEHGTPGSVLIIALFKAHVEMVVALETGEALLVRELSFNWREDDTQRLLVDIDPDFIVLAGYMRILGAAFVARFSNRILNIHPSLLPAYKGLETHRRALENGESQHGVSIHLVTAELDDGSVEARFDFVLTPV